MTVAEAAPAHNQLIQCIVIFLQDVRTPVKQVITQSVQFSEVYPEISDSQQILNVETVWVSDMDRRIKHFVDDLSFSGRLNVRVALLTDDLINKPQQVGRNPGESLGAVVGKVAIWLPCMAKIRRTLNYHSSRPKRFKLHDEMSKMELGLKIQSNTDILLSIYRLPPGEFSSAVSLVDDILYPVAVVMMIGIVWLLRVTLKALI